MKEEEEEDDDDKEQNSGNNNKLDLQTVEVAAHENEAKSLIDEMESQLQAQGGLETSFFHLNFNQPRHFTWLLVAFASMGGLLSGLDQSLISGANLYLPRDLGLSERENSLVNSGMPLGAVGGALLLSPSNEYFGRKGAILISIGMIVAARVILGLGVGLEGGTVPVYVAETVERSIRGNLVSLYQFNIALGEVLGYAVAAMFLKLPGNWRYILGSSLLFSTIMFIGMLFLPESPRYLMHKGRKLDSYKVWRRTRGISSSESRLEYLLMTATVREEEATAGQEAKNRRFPWMDFFTYVFSLLSLSLVAVFVCFGGAEHLYISVARARRALVYANIMVLLGQLTGINAIMYYMSVLMNQMGFDAERANYMSLVGGGSLLVGTIPAIFLMERFGRRFWAITMLPGFFFGLVLIGISYQIPMETHATAVEACYLTGLVIYMAFFGSYACLTWGEKYRVGKLVIPSEVYPTYLRSYGMTTSDALIFSASFAVTYNFRAMQDAMTRTGLALGFYGGIALVGQMYQIVFMPETKNKTLEEIETVLSRPTKDVVGENLAGVKENLRHLANGRFRKVLLPPAERALNGFDGS
ncbi:hypothetical protein L249_2525 [Ophiocordyceps polyrhachis-furcata BCC 54312]|uniref:Major facilitator superfamily (MFS) profile domain-containing protein n=1 Tax=Ophiocordyceps polyrhachis-furcata BCC 54312 TaxID=1330021 RepID=A0A367LNC1_9HYPO|nr:hypothetical protein L249_2525 [Ophiocordyceps polyrhachis-furcata BCC 54312]